MERDSAREEEAFNVRIFRRHSSTGNKPDMSQYQSIHTSNLGDYRRHSEPAIDIPNTRTSLRRFIANTRSPEMPLFRRSLTSNAASPRHAHSLRRDITYDSATNTIVEAPECPDPPSAITSSVRGNSESRRSRRQHGDQDPDRSARKLLEWRSPSGRESRSQSKSHTSRVQSSEPATQPLPPSRAGSRYTAPLSYITATLGTDPARNRNNFRNTTDDAETVMPDDSISCVDLRPRSRRSSVSHSRYSTRSSRDRNRDFIRDDRHRNRDDNNRIKDDRSDRTIRPSDPQRTPLERREYARAERRSSMVSLPTRPRETTRRYRFEIRDGGRSRDRSRERSRERSDGRSRRMVGTKSLA